MNPHCGLFLKRVSLICKCELISEVHMNKETKELDSKDNSLESINEVHRMMILFMRNHGSINREQLQDWLNLMSFVLNKPNNRYKIIALFIKMAISNKKLIRYKQK